MPLCVLITSSHEDASPAGRGATLVTSFDRPHPLEGPVSTESHSEVPRLGLKYMNFGRHRSACRRNDRTLKKTGTKSKQNSPKEEAQPPRGTRGGLGGPWHPRAPDQQGGPWRLSPRVSGKACAHRGQGSQQPGRGGGTGHAPGARREPGPLRAAEHSRTSARGRQGAGCERADPRASRRGVGTRGRPRPPLGGRRSTARGFSLQSPLDLTGQGSVARHGQQCPAPGHSRPQGQRQAGQPGGGEVDRGAPSRGPRAPMATAREAAGSAAGPPTGCRRKDLLPLSDAGPPGFQVAGP